MIRSSYTYKTEMILITDKEAIEIQNECISALVINSNYDAHNRPIIYASLKLLPSVYDKMTMNSENATISLRISKSSSTGGSSLNKNYIHDLFSYIMKSDPDYNKDLRAEDNSQETEYMTGIIALTKKDSMDNIKCLYNDIIKNSNMASIIHRYTKDRKMVIEPFISTDIFKSIIIPPMESLTELLIFLNEYEALYNKQYIYFEDFDSTYLLSGSGNPIHGIDKFDTIIISIDSITNSDVLEPGIVEDYKSKSYRLYVSSQSTSFTIDKVKNIEYDSIVGISSTGKVYTTSLNGKTKNTKKKLIQRIYNDNTRYIDNIKDKMDSTSIYVQISKTEVDSSIFTPNKEYLIDNYKDLSEYNGRYVLSYKKEILARQDMTFIPNLVLGFRKVDG